MIRSFRANLRVFAYLDVQRCANRMYSEALAEQSQVECKPEYPPIVDECFYSRKVRDRKKWHNKVKDLSTVEEKLFELNMPRYYGWRSYTLEEHRVPYNCLRTIQSITKTYIHEKAALPSFYDNIINDEALDSCVQDVKSQIQEALLLQYAIAR